MATALAIGKFDALHRGHRALADQAARLGEPALLTFAGMAAVLGWSPRPPLVAPGDRGRVLGEWGVRELSLPFAEIRPLDPAAFLRRLAALGADALVVGDDFRFGRDRAAGVAELPALAAASGLRWAVVPAVHIDGAAVSSSRVRAALAAGDVALAQRLLGRPHRLCATVVRGDGRGRQIGFPTANCGQPANQPPAAGVYAARAHLAGRSWPAAVNAGHVPTVSGDRPFTVEAHLIGYEGDCYGKPIALDLLARLRDERKFPGLDALKAQIAADVVAATTIAR
jgi:riboflavin kinase/FMN adenylyltransferase